MTSLTSYRCATHAVIAVVRISYDDSVCLSGVSPPDAERSPGEIETRSLHHMIA